jgi:hypothetical protein
MDEKNIQKTANGTNLIDNTEIPSYFNKPQSHLPKATFIVLYACFSAQWELKAPVMETPPTKSCRVVVGRIRLALRSSRVISV